MSRINNPNANRPVTNNQAKFPFAVSAAICVPSTNILASYPVVANLHFYKVNL